MIYNHFITSSNSKLKNLSGYYSIVFMDKKDMKAFMDAFKGASI